jgi:glucose-6-phosphate isomerase
MVSNKFFYDAQAEKEEIERVYRAIEEERKSKKVGYYDLPDAKDVVEKIKNFAANSEFIQNEMQNIVVIGIGGSSLGTKAVHTMLSHKRDKNASFSDESTL